MSKKFDQVDLHQKDPTASAKLEQKKSLDEFLLPTLG